MVRARLVIAVVLGAVVLAGCGAIGPPFVGFVANHDGHPIAGRWFAGLTVRGIGGTHLTQVDCRLAWIGRHWSYGSLPARTRRVYVPGTHRVAKVVCAWKIPKAAAGKWLHGFAAGYFAKGAEECGAFETIPVWRIRR
ncbi:MAG: hypothetical protein QOG85_125 [Gaiellaceae bacterium]|nr:hypothetical protein [Gaiellaceae bacterium]